MWIVSVFIKEIIVATNIVTYVKPGPTAFKGLGADMPSCYHKLKATK
jgi:hypothetical protein